MAFKKFTSSTDQLAPDHEFGSKLVSKFINSMMWDGKKAVATQVFSQAMKLAAQRIPDVPPLEIFETALNNVKPNTEVRSKRVGGSNYQVPMQVNRKRQQSLAIRWIVNAARGKGGQAMYKSLAQEICDAYKKEGAAITTRENMHRMADANKAFAHFAW